MPLECSSPTPTASSGLGVDLPQGEPTDPLDEPGAIVPRLLEAAVETRKADFVHVQAAGELDLNRVDSLGGAPVVSGGEATAVGIIVRQAPAELGGHPL